MKAFRIKCRRSQSVAKQNP